MDKKNEKTNLITPQGYKRLADEAQRLWTVDRPKIVDEVHQAALQGDRSENAEYIYGKRKLREIDKRLQFLQRRMDAAKVIDPRTQRSNKIMFGASVSVQTDAGQVRHYQIVGEDEADPAAHRISWKSPVGKALMNKQVDDYVEIETPNGVVELTVLSVEYK